MRRHRKRSAKETWDALQGLRHRDDDLMKRAALHDTAVIHFADRGDVVVELPPMGGETWDCQRD